MALAPQNSEKVDTKGFDAFWLSLWDDFDDSPWL